VEGGKGQFVELEGEGERARAADVAIAFCCGAPGRLGRAGLLHGGDLRFLGGKGVAGCSGK